MKRIIILSLALGLGLSLNAQEIKVKRIKQIKSETDIREIRFGERSHHLYLFTDNEEQVLRYNARFGSLRETGDPVPAETIERSTDLPSIKIKAKQMILSLPDGSNRTLAPAGDRLYIWASVSPDGKAILFRAVARGTYICDLEGKILQELGQLNAPVWAGKDWVIGMEDQDDGHRYTASEITAVHTGTGNRQVLTTASEEIALNPAISPNRDRLVFENEKGELFTMQIKIK